MELPILYSFRRCPYAMRARIAIAYSGLQCELREVSLKNKPQSMLDISPKGTVPVLQLTNGTVVEESLEVIEYALGQNDPEGWDNLTEAQHKQCNELIKLNDNQFTSLLRKYKYFNRYPEESQKDYRTQSEETYLKPLEDALSNHSYLLGNKISIADIALMPFVRQFVGVDDEWFESSEYTHIKNWLHNLLETENFTKAMVKHEPWAPGDTPILFS